MAVTSTGIAASDTGRMRVELEWSAALDRLLLGMVVCAVVVLPSLFAWQQYRATGGYLFYSNAFDEPTYLSYDGAMITRSVTRWAEYAVVWLHRAGMSGGYVNLVFDAVFPAATVVILRALCRLLLLSPLESLVFPLVVVASPVLFGYSDPYYARLYNLNFYSRGLSWIAMPQAYYPPLFRTPEPQVSLCLASVAAYFALRRRSYVPAILVAPVLYPFVSVPFGFVVLCLLISGRLQTAIASPWKRSIAAALAGCLVVGCGIALYSRLIARGTGLAEFLPATRLPLISATGVAALLLYVSIRRRLPDTLREPMLFLALAPMVASNTQIVSGLLEQPNNFEQSFGVLVLGVMLALVIVGARPWLLVSTAFACCALLALYATHIFAVNAWALQRIPPSTELIEALRREPESLVIGDPDLADMYSLMLPRTHFSALARSQTLRAEARGAGEPGTAARFQNYQCVKQAIAATDLADVVPSSTVAVLDQGFRYLGQDFPLIHLRRRTTFNQYFDPDEMPRQCRSRRLQAFPDLRLGQPVAGARLIDELASSGRWRRVPAGAELVTPEADGAYAATAHLSPQRSSARWFDVRAQLTVALGCVGVGVLTPDQREFVALAAIAAGPRPRTTDVLFVADSDPRGRLVVVRNCSARGASQATISSVDVFPVNSVGVRTVPTAPTSF
jgi:hypothetical protein